MSTLFILLCSVVLVAGFNYGISIRSFLGSILEHIYFSLCTP